eukprot:GHUV01036964.1.p1 GENE.GHUV01036964.1~~GHUV01036964.1.p1  ORF type:complete len:147 (-),score=8.13 GHUV01036964.1:656-1096(-)
MTVSAEALRWAVNVSRWQPSTQQWSVALNCLPQEVQQKCLRYLQRDDQKRAVVSQLLQRACIQQLLGEQWSRIDIQRTKGNKPFYAGSLDRQHAPNFNFNVSHEVGAIRSTYRTKRRALIQANTWFYAHTRFEHHDLCIHAAHECL